MIHLATCPEDETCRCEEGLVPVDIKEVNELGLNVHQEEVLSNIRSSITRGLPQLRVYSQQTRRVVLACGGPSLEEHTEEVLEAYWHGAAIVSVNGSYGYLLERGIRPAIHFMLDARPWNARFLTRHAPNCKYLLASQCPPAVFDRVCGWPDAEVYIWHCVGDDSEKEVLDSYYRKSSKTDTASGYLVGAGGSTVGLRALGMLCILGFRWFDVYGMDSCVSHDRHHAYAQPENDRQQTVHVRVLGREFICTLWQVAQAREFVEFLVGSIDRIHVEVHGDGLIAHLAKHIREEQKDGSR